MDISSATWWSEMDIMNMNDFQYIDMTPFDELSFTNNPFTACTYDNIQASQSAGIFEEKPAFCSSTNTIYQNTSYSNSPSPPPSSSPSVISFSNTNSPSATITTAAQNYFRNSNTSVKTEVASGTTINLSSSNISLDSDYDNSQQLFQAMGFGADDNTQKKSYCRTPLQAQDHVLAERKRRERLTQYFITLSTLIPNLKKLDKASILGDAVEYIKHLEEQVKTLEKKANKCSEEPLVAVKRPRLLSSYDNSSSQENSNKSVPDIEVRASDGNVLIRICCKKQARIIKEIFNEIEKFHLTIVNSSVIPFGCNTTHITVVAQMDHQLNMTTEYVTNKIRLSIMKLISSNEEANSLVA
ncbi:hypothetical protein RND71_033052 [Anisodus tanguticus]|uniref:BHLH domain-containing protein n=1 Tax=Anisodus tanguticus TaxID=243964 RepID=A0AAE1R8I9_9SOLA|nr:hypothetical protein RND71_033052 [Anisodus tanguticus]